MSSFIIEKVQINEVLIHPKADRLSIYKVHDYEVIATKDMYKVGDEVIYLPINTILSEELEAKLFPEGSKITLTKRRIRAANIRSVKSFGMLLNPKEFDLEYVKSNVSKYEPLEHEVPKHQQATAKRKKNTNFKEYTDIENIKWYDRVIQDNEIVVVTQKLHGTNFRAGWVPNECNTLWKRMLKLFGILPEWEFVWGSRRVQIQNKLYHRGYYDIDVYTKIVKQYDLKNVIPKGYVIYGEIVGEKIQKGYTYGCVPGEHKLYVFDIMKDKQYLSWDNFQTLTFKGDEYSPINQLENVPVLYVGPYNKQYIEKEFLEVNRLSNETNEGLVVKPIVERTSPTIGRIILKMINPKYLLEDNSEFH